MGTMPEKFHESNALAALSRQFKQMDQAKPKTAAEVFNALWSAGAGGVLKLLGACAHREF